MRRHTPLGISLAAMLLLTTTGCTDGDASTGPTSAPPTTASPEPTAPPPTAPPPTTAAAPTSASATTEPPRPTVPEPVSVGGTGFSDRQQQLLDVVREFFRATGASTLGSGPPDPAEVTAVVELFEPHGRVIWFNGTVYRASDPTFPEFVQYGNLPGVDPGFVANVVGPSGTSRTGSQFVVIEDQVVWMGHPDMMQPMVMVFSFDRGSTRISTLYLSRGDPTLPEAIGLPYTPPTHDDCTTTPAAEEVATMTIDDYLATYGQTCLHYWLTVTTLPDPTYGACRSVSGHYGDDPTPTTSGEELTLPINDGNWGQRNLCVKFADVEVGDVLEVWGFLPPHGIVDFEMIGP